MARMGLLIPVDDIDDVMQQIGLIEQENEELEITPFVKSLQTGVKIPEEYNYKKDYRDYLEKNINEPSLVS